MKEPSIEQKAKAYNEALKAAIAAHKDEDRHLKATLERIFPELKESDDERVRKEIIETFKNLGDGKIPVDINYADIFTWLEKQGKQIIDCPQNHQDTGHPNGCIVMEDFNGGEGFYKLNLDYLNKKQVREIEEIVKAWNTKSNDDIIRDEIIKVCVGMALTDVPQSRFESYGTSLKECLTWLEKQGNEPKVSYTTIVETGDGGINALVTRELPTNGCDDEQKPTDKVKPKFKIGEWITNGDYTWKIVEVKPLDYILQSQNGNIVDDTISHVDEQFHSFTIKDAKDGDVLATEDNCICIFDNTVEEGKYPFAYCGLSMYGFEVYDMTLPFTHDDVYPATKEQRDTLLKAMTDAGYEWDAEKKELKKISQHIVSAEAKEALYDKPTWSEEDEKMIGRIRSIVEKYAFSQSAVDVNGDLCEKEYIDADNWLKSLKDRYTWKPSDEQIECLYDAVKHYQTNGYPASKLNELYEQMSKIYKL